jgi:hypothetical protein
MASTAELVKTAQSARAASEILRAKVSVLAGVTPAMDSALAGIDVKTVFDLAASRVFAAAARLVDAERNPSSVDVRLDAVPADAVERPADVPVAKLAGQSIAILKRIGAGRAAALATALDTATVRDLALWPPYLAAKEILAEAFFPEALSGFDRDAPADLLPRTGAFPTERLFYRTLLIDAAPPGPQGTTPTPIEQSDAIDVLPAILSPTGFQRLATGALLTFSQSWFAQGLTLGQLLHSTSLAPGESTRLAMVDWTRRSRASANEDISEAEQLSNTSVHARALSEVTSGTARDFQAGTSTASVTSTTSQSGSGFGFEIGPLGFGGSSGGSTTTTEAMSATSSFGARSLSAQFAQNINDRSQQHASSVRNRRASIVREVSQEEHEAISTRVVTNYNHMHALSVQYYEVVQAFRVTSQLERAERCLFVPLKLVNFRDPAIVERHRLVLARAALTPTVARQLAEFGTVKVTTEFPLRRLLTAGALARVSTAASRLSATAGADADSTESEATSTAGDSPTTEPPGRKTYTQPTSRIAQLKAAGWNLQQLERLGRLGGRLLLPTRTNAVYVPEEALVIGFSLRAGQAGGFLVRRLDGRVVELQDVAATGAGFVAPVPVTELRSLSVENLETKPRPTALVLQLSVFGTLETLDVPVHLDGGGEFSGLQECVRFDGGASTRDLVDHLEANKLHYSQSIFRTLDGPAIASLLARFTFRGVPLAQLVDQQPVAVSANSLVFKMNMPAAGDTDDPRLAEDLTAWRTFLTRAGLDRPVPKTEVIPLPSGGVFAEAVLGRFNAAERLEPERFWNWQDSPIPITAPEIAAISAGSRATPEDLTPGQLSAPVVSIQAPTALPDSAGVAGALTAIQNANLFRDMSGLAQTAALAQTAQQVTAAGATAVEQQAGQNLFTVMDQNTQRMRIAAQLAAQMAGLPATGAAGGAGSKGKGSLTEAGGDLRTAGEIDAQKQAGGNTTAQEETFRAQTGAKARELAGKIIGAASSTPDEAASRPASIPARGVGPKQDVPRAITTVLSLSSFFGDPGIFGPTPVKLELLVTEPGGKHLLERRSGPQPTLSGTVTTTETRLNAQLTFTYEVLWPGPTPTVSINTRSLGLNVAPGEGRVDMASFVVLDTKTVTLPGPTAPASDSALASALRAQGVDLIRVPVKPTVSTRAGGGFDATFKLIQAVSFEQLSGPPGPA